MGPVVVDFWWAYQPVPHLNPDNPNEGSQFSLLINGILDRDWQWHEATWNHEENINLEERKPYNLTWIIYKYKYIPGSDAIGWIDNLNISSKDTTLLVELQKPDAEEKINLSADKIEIEFRYIPFGDSETVSSKLFLDNKLVDVKSVQPTKTKGSFIVEFDAPGRHTWMIECCNNVSECNSSELSNFSILVPQPKVNILLPEFICPKKDLCLYIWIVSFLNISKAEVTIDANIL